MIPHSAISRFREAIDLSEALRVMDLRARADPILKAAHDLFRLEFVKYINQTIELGIHEYQTSKQENSNPSNSGPGSHIIW